LATDLLHSFIRYACVGVGNTVVHALLFLALVYQGYLGQASANVVAFLVAVSFSYAMNARWTFRTQRSMRGYLLFTGCMGVLAFLVGWAVQVLAWPPLITLCLFSGLSLLLGFVWARCVVFQRSAP
jgi:putative flippase GtrA